VIAAVVVVGHKGLDLGFQIARQVIVLQQDPVLQRLMPTLDLALGHRVIWSAADVGHVVALQPFRQVV
jgi:hypothetical protein